MYRCVWLFFYQLANKENQQICGLRGICRVSTHGNELGILIWFLLCNLGQFINLVHFNCLSSLFQLPVCKVRIILALSSERKWVSGKRGTQKLLFIYKNKNSYLLKRSYSNVDSTYCQISNFDNRKLFVGKSLILLIKSRVQYIKYLLNAQKWAFVC